MTQDKVIEYTLQKIKERVYERLNSYPRHPYLLDDIQAKIDFLKDAMANKDDHEAKEFIIEAGALLVILMDQEIL